MSTPNQQEITYLKPDDILIPEERVTSQLDPEILDELRESIKEHGILEPLLVARVEGKYVLIDGLHRLVIAKELGMDKVPCVVREMREDELLITNLIVNRQRGKSNPAEEAKLVKLLVDEYNYSMNEVARKLGMSKSTVDRYYQIASRLDDQVMEMLRQGMLSVGCAYWISFLDDRSKQREIAKSAVEYGYTVEQCKEAVRLAMHPEEPPPPGGWTFDESGKPVRVPVKAFPCGREVDPSQVIYIPVEADLLDDLKILFSEYCKEFGIASGEEQGSAEGERSEAPETTGQPQEEEPKPKEEKARGGGDWWPF